MTRDGTTLLIDLIFLVIATIFAFLILAFLARHRPFQPLRDWLAPIPVPDRVKLVGFAIWSMLFVFLLFGVFSSVYNVLKMLPDVNDASDDTPFRAALLTITAMTATLGALIALPFTLVRALTTERQTRTQEEGYVTQQINEAVANLAAEKTVTRLGRSFSYMLGDKITKSFEWQGESPTLPEGATRTKEEADWKPAERTEPNIEVRIGGLLALERLARQRATAAVADRANSLKTENALISDHKKLQPVGNNYERAKTEKAFAATLVGCDRRSSDFILDHDGARDHVRIMEILCTYIRENAPARDAPEHDPGDGAAESEGTSEEEIEKRKEARETRLATLRQWIKTLEPPRADVQTALRVLGRRTQEQRTCEGVETLVKTTFRQRDIPEINWRGHRLDLRNTNLQKADLSHSNDTLLFLAHARLAGARIEGAVLKEAQMERADLTRARMEGADLYFTRMEGANLREARMEGANLQAFMEGADLRGARMEGADLQAEMKGADLTEALFDKATDFSQANLLGAGLKSVDLSMLSVDPNLLKWAFGDSSVKLPDGLTAGQPPLEHWSTEDLAYNSRNREDSPFHIAWRAWQEQIGYVPPGR